MLNVSVHLKVNQLLVCVDEFVASVGVYHRQFLYLVEVFLQRKGVANGVRVFFTVVIHLQFATLTIEVQTLCVWITFLRLLIFVVFMRQLVETL